MKIKKRILTLFAAVMLCMAAFPLTAYAGGGPTNEETPVVETTPEPTAAPNPFTPAGTGTVVDNATDADGKEFYTIMTPNENVFYLIIDKQRQTENVYFLNAVTEQDLMALAEISENSGTTTIPAPEPMPEPTPEPTPEPEPAPKKGGSMGMVVVVLIVLAGGGAAYYFKIYKPKQEQAETGEDYEDYDELEDYEAEADESEDDTSLWHEDEDGGDGDE